MVFGFIREKRYLLRVPLVLTFIVVTLASAAAEEPPVSPEGLYVGPQGSSGIESGYDVDPVLRSCLSLWDFRQGEAGRLLFRKEDGSVVFDFEIVSSGIRLIGEGGRSVVVEGSDLGFYIEPELDRLTIHSDESFVATFESEDISSISEIGFEGEDDELRFEFHQIPSDAEVLDVVGNTPQERYLYLFETLKESSGTRRTFHLPPGIYDIACPSESRVVPIESVELVGAGVSSVIRHVDNAFGTVGKTAFRIGGEGSIVSHLTIEVASHQENRTRTPEMTLLYVAEAERFAIDHVDVSGGSGAGIFVQGSSNGLVSDSFVSRCLADGIHITQSEGGAPSSDIVIRRNRVSECGDDGIAVVSYGDLGKAAPCSGVTVVSNHISGQTWGRGIAVSGGRDIEIVSNIVSDSPSAGILVTSEKSYGTLEVTNVSVRQNLIVDCKSSSHAAITVTTGNRIIDQVELIGNTVRNPRRSAIAVMNYIASNDNAVSEIVIRENTIENCLRDFAVYASRVKNLTIERNTIVNTKKTCVTIVSPQGSVFLYSNQFVNVSLLDAYGDVVALSAPDGSDCIVGIVNNRVSLDESKIPPKVTLRFPERFLEISHDMNLVTIEGNEFDLGVPDSVKSILWR